MSTYYGYWSVNHGQSYNREAYTYTNKRSAVASIKTVARGNCPIGSHVSWSIYDCDRSQSIGDDEPILCGVIRR